MHALSELNCGVRFVKCALICFACVYCNLSVGCVGQRWRRRWFTLKQGEIPEQFCLEYYTDRNCRKLKGVIDLDQCEQVDSGLRLEHRKQKFQHMFDVKTPRRTYYLAADSEEDMIEWVKCICQVCNLQDLSKQQSQTNNDNRQCE